MAVQKAVHVKSGLSADGPHRKQIGGSSHVNVPKGEDGSRPMDVEGSGRLHDPDGGQEDFQRGWEAEQEWLQECAGECHEVGPWGDLVV